MHESSEEWAEAEVPWSALCVPAGQTVEEDDPELGWYVPAEQSKQGLPPELYVSWARQEL